MCKSPVSWETKNLLRYSSFIFSLKQTLSRSAKHSDITELRWEQKSEIQQHISLA